MKSKQSKQSAGIVAIEPADAGLVNLGLLAWLVAAIAAALATGDTAAELPVID
jgi:hypothetical protein